MSLRKFESTLSQIQTEFKIANRVDKNSQLSHLIVYLHLRSAHRVVVRAAVSLHPLISQGRKELALMESGPFDFGHGYSMAANMHFTPYASMMILQQNGSHHSAVPSMDSLVPQAILSSRPPRWTDEEVRSIRNHCFFSRWRRLTSFCCATG